MIPVRIPQAEDVLDARARKLLAKRQEKANDFATNDSRVEPAWKSFRGTKSARQMAAVLAEIFHGKCAYCEQESAKDVEHYFPKCSYPGRMFLWDNFLWACKNCDTDKLDQFPLDSRENPLLLHPGRDDPLDYFCWDLLSGKMVLHPDPARGERARQTRDLLHLDQHSVAEERRNKLHNVVYLLARVVKEDPVAEDTLARLRDELAAHRPWLSIVRQLFTRPDHYQVLVEAARSKVPAINAWLKAWMG
jgi:uncharacterized protein (TIGR02646 family)